ncbi:MAG: TonB-dependent receptor, partial [Starkeya sp.]|nr:TonB-dependent receptor [Starkeya sp.]
MPGTPTIMADIASPDALSSTRGEAPRISFVSLGCPKALVDSERIITSLRSEGYELSRHHEGADLVIVNTCGFLDSAKAESLAAFAQATYTPPMLDQLHLTVGARYTSDKKVFTSINVRQRDNVKFVDVTKEATFNKFTPRFGLNYKATDDILLYASFSRGFKQGGFNGRPLDSAAEVTQYAPETLDTYEGGVKAKWLDGALTTNLAVFHSLYKNIQLTVNQTPQNFVANAASGKIDGFELETVMRPANWFSANLAVGYTHARYTSVGQGLGPTQVLPITINSKFVKTPEWTVSAGAEVSHGFNDGSDARLRVDYTMYSRIYNDVANTPIITQGGYGLLNARFSYTFANDALTFSAFGTNLTNTLYLLSGNASSGFGLAE